MDLDMCEHSEARDQTVDIVHFTGWMITCFFMSRGNREFQYNEGVV